MYWFTMAALIPLTCYFESMKQLSFLSLTALASIVCALAYIMATDVAEIVEPTMVTELSFSNVLGIPYFFGIALFMFEGNALALEIY